MEQLLLLPGTYDWLLLALSSCPTDIYIAPPNQHQALYHDPYGFRKRPQQTSYCVLWSYIYIPISQAG